MQEKKIKILFGINKLLVGGAERLMLAQIAGIDRKRFTPSLVTLLPETEPNFSREADALGLSWEHFTFRGFFDVRSFWKLYQYMLRERFHVVVANLFFTGIMLRSAAYLAGVPVILMHEVNVSTEEGRKGVVIEKIFARITDVFMAVSQEVIAVRAPQLGISPKKFALTYSAIDVSSITIPISFAERASARGAMGFGESDIVIGSAGRLTQQKGHTYLIDACALLLKKETVPLKLVIFGEGHLRQAFLKHASALGITESVSFPGVRPLREIMAISDIFVLPSLWEGMSLMLIEAMAGGKAIVATEVSGARELIQSGKNGFLVPPKNTILLAEKIELLVDDAELRETLGHEAIKKSKDFSIEKNLERLTALIESILLKKGIHV